MKVGDRVIARKHLDEWSDAHGQCRCAAKGDLLIIREVRETSYLVSHEDRTDGMTFRADHDEVDPE